jgi:ribose-phosphate pyrophosphokinase
MDKIIFAMPGNESVANKIALKIELPVGEMELRSFPDAETYVRLLSDVSKKEVIIVCTLNQPDSKLLPLYFLSKLLKDFGAEKITLVAPYLSYMRQDKRFHDGEAITSNYFASLISSFADELITIDPHLHRRNSMSEIYSIPCKVLHAAPLISNWITENIEMPLLVGPDSESEQWVKETAEKIKTPYIVLSKIRISDTEVKISVPEVEQFKQHTPVLIDDIISTARTMMVTAEHLSEAGLKPVTCIGVHGLFAGNAYNELLQAGVGKIITCNTIPHHTNKIDMSELIINSLKC